MCRGKGWVLHQQTELRGPRDGTWPMDSPTMIGLIYLGHVPISWTSGGIRWVPNGTHIAVGNDIKWAMKVVQWFVRRLTYMPFWCFHVVANPLRNKSGKEYRLIEVWNDKHSPLRAQNKFIATVPITILEPGVLVSRGMCHRSMMFLNLHHTVPPQSLLNTIKSL